MDLRKEMLREYQFFKTGTGSYQGFFDQKDDQDVKEDSSISRNKNKTIRIEDVLKWVSKTGGHMSRLAWFSTWKPTSTFFLKIARPLLSLRTTGSMTVERVAKPLKNFVYSKFRRRMSTGSSNLLLCTGLNLRFLAQAKLGMSSGHNH